MRCQLAGGFAGCPLTEPLLRHRAAIGTVAPVWPASGAGLVAGLELLAGAGLDSNAVYPSHPLRKACWNVRTRASSR